MDDYWLPYITKDSIVVDAGASYGIYTLSSALAGASKVYAFEPIKRIADILRKNVILNDWSDRIEVFDDLLWSASNIELKFDDKVWGSTQLFDDEDKCILLSTLSLDDFINTRDIDRLDLIKIDVEGAEVPVLLGAKKLILKYKPKILIEVHKDYQINMSYIMCFFTGVLNLNANIQQIMRDRYYIFVEFE